MADSFNEDELGNLEQKGDEINQPESEKESLEELVSNGKVFQELNKKYEKLQFQKNLVFGIMASSVALTIAIPAIMYLTGQYTQDQAMGAAGIILFTELFCFFQINDFLDAREAFLKTKIMLKREDLKKEKIVSTDYEHLQDEISEVEETNEDFDDDIGKKKDEM
jgi:hypothetical protein